MASTEDSLNPPPPPQQQPILQPPAQQQPSTLLQYPEMIIAAIEALNEETGSSKAAISKEMESTNLDLPAAHSTLLSHNLNRMTESGVLVMMKNNYMKPDPNAPPKRGRGRPPKPKAPLPPGTVISPPRPRGRPPKPRDPFAPPKKMSSTGSGRPRGRPAKKVKTTPATAPAAATNTTGAPRGRGRPPKVKPAVAPVAG